MQFPTFVYRCPGVHQRTGGTYTYQSVQDEAGHAESLKGGWFATLPEAIDAHDNPKKPAMIESLEKLVDAVASDAPPTRAELEQKAKELGLKFDGRTTDKKLAALIAEKV